MRELLELMGIAVPESDKPKVKRPLSPEAKKATQDYLAKMGEYRKELERLAHAAKRIQAVRDAHRTLYVEQMNLLHPDTKDVRFDLDDKDWTYEVEAEAPDGPEQPEWAKTMQAEIEGSKTLQ